MTTHVYDHNSISHKGSDVQCVLSLKTSQRYTVMIKETKSKINFMSELTSVRIRVNPSKSFLHKNNGNGAGIIKASFFRTIEISQKLAATCGVLASCK